MGENAKDKLLVLDKNTILKVRTLPRTHGNKLVICTFLLVH